MTMYLIISLMLIAGIVLFFLYYTGNGSTTNLTTKTLL